MQRIKVLTIAGSDPSGGAGIQQDLKVFSQLGVYGMAVISAITVQNTTGVKKFSPVASDLLREQIEFSLQDIKPHAIKTGMLASEENVRVVSKILEKSEIPLVVDPVLASSYQDPLFEGEIRAFTEHLFPIATVITPNISEASVFAKIEIKDLEDMKKAAGILKSYGSQWVLIKGGDLNKKEVIDLIFDGKNFHYIAHPRVGPSKSHGTGCALSSLLAVFLAHKVGIYQAYKKALEYMELFLISSKPVGKGAYPVNPLVIKEREEARVKILEHLSEAVSTLESLSEMRDLVPEVQMNLCEAIPFAKSYHDVAGISGRIVKTKQGLKAVGCPEFGASRHVASIVLTAMRYNPDMRAAANIKYDEQLIGFLKRHGFEIASFSRKDEPYEIKIKEGSTLEWGVKKVCEEKGYVPEIIYDTGDVGKEPMIRVLGKNALDVVEKLKRILKIKG